VAVAFSIAWPGSEVEPVADEDGQARVRLAAFRRELYRCFTARADALFELADTVLCADGPVKTLVGLSLAPEHQRGHGALYDAVNCGGVEIGRLRRSLAGLPMPRAADGRLMLAVDVSSWLRPGAATSPERLFCHVYGRGKGQAQMFPGWPYSVIAAACTCRKPRPRHATRRYLLIRQAVWVCLRMRCRSRSTGSGSGFSGAAASSDRCGRC
jgi:DDE superfamily endonuclease